MNAVTIESAGNSTKGIGMVGTNISAKYRTFAVNEKGLRVGEDHPRASLANHEVDLLLELRADGMSYGALAKKFDVSKSCAAKICRGENRAQVAAGFKRSLAATAGG